MANTYHPKYILITETWLHKKIPNKIVNIENYTLVRNDRSRCRGGGVCIFIKKTIYFECHSFIDFPESIEYLCISDNAYLHVLLYIPPNISSIDISNAFNSIVTNIDHLLNQNSHLSPLIYGDVNKSPWQNLCIQLNQKNIVSCPTRKSALLDIFLVPTNENAFSTLVKDPIANSDHNTIHIIKEKNTNTQLSHELFYYRSSHLYLLDEKDTTAVSLIAIDIKKAFHALDK